MTRPEHRIYFILLFFTTASGLGWFINSYSPAVPAAFIWFYLLLSGTLFFLMQAIGLGLRRSLLTAFGLVGILVLRGIKLRHPLYPMLFLSFLLSLEYAISSLTKRR